MIGCAKMGERGYKLESAQKNTCSTTWFLYSVAQNIKTVTQIYVYKRTEVGIYKGRRMFAGWLLDFFAGNRG